MRLEAVATAAARMVAARATAAEVKAKAAVVCVAAVEGQAVAAAVTVADQADRGSLRSPGTCKGTGASHSGRAGSGPRMRLGGKGRRGAPGCNMPRSTASRRREQT